MEQNIALQTLVAKLEWLQKSNRAILEHIGSLMKLSDWFEKEQARCWLEKASIERSLK